MKKGISVLTAVICVALSLTVFTLPGLASNMVAAASTGVMETAPPKEYMNDFSVAEDEPGKQPDYSKYYNTVFITENQIDELKAVVEKAFMDELGIEIPAGMAFEYNTIDQTSIYGGINLHMNWKDERAAALSDEGFRIYNDGVTFGARFEISAQSNGLCAELKSFGTSNGYADALVDGLKEQAVAAFTSELGVTIPDDYILNTGVNVSYNDNKQQNTFVSFEWYESDQMLESRCVSAAFDNADLSGNTGKLTQLTDSAVYSGEPSGLPELTKVQETEILEAAKRFFAEKGVAAGEIMQRGGATRSYQLDWNGGKAMWFVLNQVPENNSGRAYMEIIITSDFHVLGYAY